MTYNNIKDSRLIKVVNAMREVRRFPTSRSSSLKQVVLPRDARYKWSVKQQNLGPVKGEVVHSFT